MLVRGRIAVDKSLTIEQERIQRETAASKIVPEVTDEDIPF